VLGATAAAENKINKLKYYELLSSKSVNNIRTWKLGIETKKSRKVDVRRKKRRMLKYDSFDALMSRSSCGKTCNCFSKTKLGQEFERQEGFVWSYT
jgi:hypothetical protein